MKIQKLLLSSVLTTGLTFNASSMQLPFDHNEAVDDFVPQKIENPLTGKRVNGFDVSNLGVLGGKIDALSISAKRNTILAGGVFFATLAYNGFNAVSYFLNRSGLNTWLPKPNMYNAIAGVVGTLVSGYFFKLFANVKSQSIEMNEENMSLIGKLNNYNDILNNLNSKLQTAEDSFEKLGNCYADLQCNMERVQDENAALTNEKNALESQLNTLNKKAIFVFPSGDEYVEYEEEDLQEHIFNDSSKGTNTVLNIEGENHNSIVEEDEPNGNFEKDKKDLSDPQLSGFLEEELGSEDIQEFGTLNQLSDNSFSLAGDDQDKDDQEKGENIAQIPTKSIDQNIVFDSNPEEEAKKEPNPLTETVIIPQKPVDPKDTSNELEVFFNED